MGAFCTIAKISGEMPKKGLKTGKNGIKFFLGPSHMLNNNIGDIFFILNIFHFAALQIFFFNNFVEISPENRVLKEPK